MPSLKNPSLFTLGDPTVKPTRHAVSFAFSFDGEPIVPLNLGNISMSGAQFALDIASLQTPAILPSIKALQFNYFFPMSDVGTQMCGPLVVYVPASGLTHVIPPPSTAVASGAVCVVSSIIAIIDTLPSRIIIAAGVGSAGSLAGKFVGTAFDFDVPGVNYNGIAYLPGMY